MRYFCISASDKPDLGLEELSSLNVKSRFDLKKEAQGALMKWRDHRHKLPLNDHPASSVNWLSEFNQLQIYILILILIVIYKVIN